MERLLTTEQKAYTIFAKFFPPSETLCVLTQMKRGSWRTTEWIVAGLFPFGWLCGQDKMAPSEVFSTAITMRLIGQERVRESFADECPRYRPPLKGKRSEEADANAEKPATDFPCFLSSSLRNLYHFRHRIALFLS